MRERKRESSNKYKWGICGRGRNVGRERLVSEGVLV